MQNNPEICIGTRKLESDSGLEMVGLEWRLQHRPSHIKWLQIVAASICTSATPSKLPLIFWVATKLSFDCKVLGSGTMMMILAMMMIMIYHIDDGNDGDEACIATERRSFGGASSSKV